jgi:hypothetical protein
MGATRTATDLVDVFKPQRRETAIDQQVLVGKLVIQSGKRWARIDGAGALTGPLIGGENVPSGTDIIVGIAQDGKPYVVWAKSWDAYEFYEQNTEPTEASIGAWWVDTNSA